MGIFIKRRPVQQPQCGTLIDRSNPLSAALAVAWSAARPSLEQVSGKTATTNNTTRSTSKSGIVASCSVSQTNVEWASFQPITTSNGAGAGDFTMMVIANPAAGGGSIGHMLAQKNDAGGAPYNQAGLFSNSNSQTVYESGSVCFFTYAGTVSSVAATSVLDGDYHAWIGVRRSGVMELYRDGTMLASASQDVKIITATPNRYLAIGSRGNGTSESFPNSILFVSGWNRALNAGEIYSMSQNPWQIFRSERRVIVSLPADGSSSLSAAGGSISTGTATPSVSYSLAAIGVAASGGSAGPSVALDLSAAGLVVSGGSASPYISDALAASGGSATGGAAGQTATVTIQAAGLVQSAGSAGLYPSVLIQAAGAALSSGNAELAVTALQAAAGSAQSSGNAIWAAQIAAAAAGTVTTSGLASLGGGPAGALDASGGSASGGSAGIILTVALSATGGSTIGGTATHTATVQITAAGIVQAAGHGALVLHIDLDAFGSAQSSGAAVAVVSNSNYPLSRLPSYLIVQESPVFMAVTQVPVFIIH